MGEQEKERKSLHQREVQRKMMEESLKESAEDKLKKEEDLKEQARLEKLRLETLRRLNEEHGQKLRKFVADSRCLPVKSRSKSTIEKVSSEAQRQSIVVDQAERDIKTVNNKALEETCTKISKLESSIASLDWELERYEIEKMKAKTEKVMKRMSSYATVTNGYVHADNCETQ